LQTAPCYSMSCQPSACRQGSFDIVVDSLLKSNFPRNRRARLHAVSFDTPTDSKGLCSVDSAEDSTEFGSDESSQASPVQWEGLVACKASEEGSSSSIDGPPSDGSLLRSRRSSRFGDCFVVAKTRSRGATIDYEFLGDSSDEEFPCDGRAEGKDSINTTEEIAASTPSMCVADATVVAAYKSCDLHQVTSRHSGRRRRLHAMLRSWRHPRSDDEDVPAVGGAPRMPRRRVNACSTRRMSCESQDIEAPLCDLDHVEDIPAVGGAPRPQRRRLSACSFGTAGSQRRSSDPRVLQGPSPDA